SLELNQLFRSTIFGTYYGILVLERLGIRGMKSEVAMTKKMGIRKEEHTIFNLHIKDANSEEFEPYAKHKIVINVSDISPT
ncbi:14536_t:CDS:2, partial [Gigaspora margarita]